MEGILLIIRIFIALGIGVLGDKRKIGFGWAFGFSVISPLVGLIITLCSSKKNKKTFIDINKD